MCLLVLDIEEKESEMLSPPSNFTGKINSTAGPGLLQLLRVPNQVMAVTPFPLSTS